MPLQYRVEWTGFGGGGLTVLNFRTRGGSTTAQAADDIPPLVRNLFQVFANLLPDNVTVSFPPEVQELDTATGQLLGVFPVTSPASVTGAAPAQWAAPAGARIDWLTPAIVAGHRLRGRTFIVPLVIGAYDDEGTLTPLAMQTIRDAGESYINEQLFVNAEPVVWSRTHGILADVVAVSVPDEVAILRGRRG